MTDSNDKQKNQDGPKLTGHVYDGIEEFDNSLPKWWIYLFYITIVFACGYGAYYLVGGGPTLVQEYEQAQKEAQLAELAAPKPVIVASEAELRALLKNPEAKATGQKIFDLRCVPCHGTGGAGGIGPNLVDGYWIHGGKMTNIVQTMTQGVLDKGMPAWGPLLSQSEIHSVAAYVKSLKGTHPPGAKAPQGDLEKDAD
ncbi:MAG TPA: cbb3-type cytochrome c oxidase N-terminal domain-containing protein [Bdellovibrionota bacterium]|jgi:cytochrome c oxidase cbb3-type subunit 3|nr:cbb3-type cytochrome c oxidase N-terminal domain-containing protein [Bdellovibrionota bacterium]